MNELADYIPILIAIGFGVYQLFRFLGKSSSTPEQRPRSTPPPTDPFGGKKDETWDDLLEALGQKPKQDHSRPVQPPPPPVRVNPVAPKAPAPPRSVVTTPPPVPRAPVPPVVSRPVPFPSVPLVPKSAPPPVPASVEEESSPFGFYQPQLNEELAARFKSYDLGVSSAPSATPGFSTRVMTSTRAASLKKLLGDRERLRETIVLREILDKPLALR